MPEVGVLCLPTSLFTLLLKTESLAEPEIYLFEQKG